MPEEHNRRLTDHLSDVLLTHSADADENLAREGITEGVHLVGNTMIDSLLEHVERARAGRPWERYGAEEGDYLLVTLHRPALVDDDTRLAAVVAGLERLAREQPVIFPVHPRTRARLRAEIPGVTLTDPLGYHDFLGLEAAARAVVTDSGGVQEETSALGVRCFTLRSSTERPVTVSHGTNTLVADLAEVPALLQEEKPGGEIPLWDGRAGERAARVLLDELGQ